MIATVLLLALGVVLLVLGGMFLTFFLFGDTVVRP